MMVHKYSPGGTFVIDMQFKHIGRIHLASGMTHAPTFTLFKAALKEMAKETSGREWIRAMKRGEVAPLDVWGVYKEGKWHEPPRPETAKSLIKALEDWREETFRNESVSKHTYNVRKATVDRARECAREGATIDELPTVLRAMKRRMAKAAPTFNLHRNYLRAFVRDTFGTRHELYQVIKHDIAPIHIPGHAKKKERKRHPLTPAEVLLLASKFPTRFPGGAEGAPGHGYNAIQMALLGTNPKEYFVDGWAQALTFVKVAGEKRGGRDRMVPKLFPSKLWPSAILKQPTITQHSFERAFAIARKAAKLNCTPLDLRRSHSNWMEAAGVDRALRRQIRGHGPKDVGDLYETRQLQKHLVDVAQLMISWINQQLEQRPQLVAEEGR